MPENNSMVNRMVKMSMHLLLFIFIVPRMVKFKVELSMHLMLYYYIILRMVKCMVMVSMQKRIEMHEDVIMGTSMFFLKVETGMKTYLNQGIIQIKKSYF